MKLWMLYGRRQCYLKIGRAQFLNITAYSVGDVNKHDEIKGIMFEKKAIIQTGKPNNINGNWEDAYSTGKLQKDISNHWPHPDGQPANPENVETESDSKY